MPGEGKALEVRRGGASTRRRNVECPSVPQNVSDILFTTVSDMRARKLSGYPGAHSYRLHCKHMDCVAFAPGWLSCLRDPGAGSWKA